MAGRDWISWLAGRIMKCILQKHQKEQICFIRHFEKKSCAEQYMKTTINLLPNILACLLCLFWTCVVSPGCWIWPWFCSLACPIYWLCHCGNTNNLPLCHNVASSILLSCPFKTAAHVIHPLFQLLLLFTTRVQTAETCWKYFTAYIFVSLPSSVGPWRQLSCFVPSSELLCAFSGFPWH